MSKYIDAEKLIAEIRKHLIPTILDRDYDEWEKGKDTGLQQAIGIVEALQQEQPELPGYDKALLEVKSKVDELYEETSIGLCEYDSGLYNGIAETCMKLRGFIKARLHSDEQPEVDLDREIMKYKVPFTDESEYLNETTLDAIARHFYELGRARKEE